MSHKATNWAIQQRGLKPSTKIILWFLSDCHNSHTGRCDPCQATLAEECEMSRSTVNLHLADLEKRGLIRRIQRSNAATKTKKSTLYILARDDQKPQDVEKAVSEKTPKPCPKKGRSRVRPIGHKPVKNLERTSAGAREGVQKTSDIACFWAEKGQSMTETAETKRDRVRRLLIDPLADIGFRFAKGVKAEKAQKDLDRIADGLAYLSDENLKLLFHSLKTKGEGTARCFWPCYATITGLAEVAQPRPLKHEPNLLSWFASRAGREAKDAGRLVAEFQFFERHKLPPVNETDKRNIARSAAECADRVMRIEDKLNRKFTLAADDQGFIEWYQAQLTYCTNLVNGGVECS